MRTAIPLSVLLLVIASAAGAQDQPTGSVIPVAPKGEFSKIDVRATMQAMDVLQSENAAERKRIIVEIEKNSANYAPPVFFTLAHVLWAEGRKDDAIFWFNAGSLRGRFDAARCADETARQGIVVMIMGIPDELRLEERKDLAKWKATVQKVIKWDEDTPCKYDHRWINLHGMGFYLSALNESSRKAAPVLSLPKEQWPALAKQTRENYLSQQNTAMEKARNGRAKAE